MPLYRRALQMGIEGEQQIPRSPPPQPAQNQRTLGTPAPRRPRDDNNEAEEASPQGGEGMKLYRIRAIIERDMRKFLRSPALMMTSMVFPLMQLIVLGYAFGGKIKNVRLALVDDDRSAESRLVRERLNAIQDGPQTFRVYEYNTLTDAMTDLRAGFVKAVLNIPKDFSERVLRSERPRLAFVEDNTDTFTANGILERIQQIQTTLNGPELPPLQPVQPMAATRPGMVSPNRLPATIVFQSGAAHPFIEYLT